MRVCRKCWRSGWPSAAECSGTLQKTAAGAAYALRHRRDEPVGIAWLAHDKREVLCFRLAEIGAGHHHHWNVAGVGAGFELAVDVVAAETRQREIEDDESRQGLFNVTERIRPILYRNNGIPGGAQRHPVHLTQLRIVLDDEDLPPRRRSHATNLMESFCS